MRVLHFATSAGGGVPQAIIDHVYALGEVDHFVLWPVENDSLDTRRQAVKYPLKRNFSSQIRQFRSTCMSVKPDVVVAHSSIAGAIVRLLPQRSEHVFYQPHGFAFEAENRSKWQRRQRWRIESALARRADTIVAITEREKILGERLGASSIARVRNCSHQLPRTLLGGDGRTVVTVGRIAPQKDPNFFAEVAIRVRSKLPEARFVWIGDGEKRLRRELERLFAVEGVGG